MAGPNPWDPNRKGWAFVNAAEFDRRCKHGMRGRRVIEKRLGKAVARLLVCPTCRMQRVLVKYARNQSQRRSVPR